MGKRKFNKGDSSSKTEMKESEDKESEEVKDDSDPPKKTKKETSNSKFDIKHFRKELVAKQGQTIALTQFLQVCLNPDSDEDYMLEYLKSGGNSHEILRQISSESKKNLTLTTPTFHIFQLIVMKVQSSLPHMFAITEEACRYFLNNFSSTIEIMISENSGPKHRKIILKLLTSMVTLNPDLGLEVLNQAPLSPKNLQYILEKPNYKEKDNVRTCFVQFMTSFLVEGHLPLIKALLEKQGLLALVIPGLIQDEAESVLMFLNILKKNVIENPLISKSLKLKTFNHNVLHQLMKLYFWRGPPESDHEFIKQCKPEVINLLTEIVLILFTSNKLGLYFVDSTLGTSDANKNQNLYKALSTLKRPWENTHLGDVVLEIVKKCPDLHRAVIGLLEQSFEPQQSPIWERAIAFFVKLLEKLNPDEMSQRLSNLNAAQTANFIRFQSLPVPLLKHLNAGLNKDKVIAIHCIKVLTKMLESLKKYLYILEMNNFQYHNELKNKLEYFLPKHMPLPSVIVTSIEQIMKGTHKVDKSQDYKLPEISTVDSLIALIDLLLLYSDMHSTLFESLEGSLNIKEILNFGNSLSEENVAILRFKIVSLWLAIDSSAVSVKNPLFKTLFQILLDIYTESEGNMWAEAKPTLFNFFKCTSIFESEEDEIHIILYALRNCKVDTSILCDMVEHIMENYKQLSEDLRNKLVDSEIIDEQDEMNIGKILEDLMKNNSNNDTYAIDNKTLTPFLIGCLKYLNKKEDLKTFKQFLSIYVANLLHFNCKPEIILPFIENIKIDGKQYVTDWLLKPTSLGNQPAGNNNTLQLISKAVIEDDDLKLNEIFDFLNEANSLEATILSISEENFIIADVIIDDSELLIWGKFLIFCIARLSHMKELNELKRTKIFNILQVILKVSKLRHKLDVCRTILLSLFKNSNILNLYKPLDCKKEDDSILATKFILDVIEQNHDLIEYLRKRYAILKSYQKRNSKEINKILTKPKKKYDIDAEHTVRVLKTIGLDSVDNNKILQAICEKDSNLLIKEDKEPTVLLEIARVIVSEYTKSISLELPQDLLQNIFSLYTKLLTDKEVLANLTNLETELAIYFENKPHRTKSVSEDNFRQFFFANTSRKSTYQLASVLLKLNIKFCLVLKEELARQEIVSQRELTLPLVNAMLEHKKFVIQNNQLLCSVYNEYKNNISKLLEKPHKAGQIYTSNWRLIQKLIYECMDIKDCQKYFSKIQKFDMIEHSHLQLVQAVFLRIVTSEVSLNDSLTHYILTMLNVFITALKDAKYSNLIEDIAVMLHSVTSICDYRKIGEASEFKKILEHSSWQSFCKAVLKDSLKMKTLDDDRFQTAPKLLHLLTKLVKLMYPEDHEDVVTLFDMVTSHSEFLKVMLSHNSPEIKSRLIEFLYTLIQKNKSVIKPQQIPVYLSSYHATRQPSDRLLLNLIHFYETNDLPVNDYKPYVFGDTAANHYSVRKNRTTLWAHPTPNQVLNLFDKEIIEKTIQNFPVTQRLTYSYEMPENLEDRNVSQKILESYKREKIDVLEDNEGKFLNIILKIENNKVIDDFQMSEITTVANVADDDEIYDPAFLFPLLSHLLAPGSVASCFKLLRAGLLSVPVMALSSFDPDMRAAAYHVLHRFCLLLETESRHKNDKLLLTDFIEMLRQSLSSAIVTPGDNDAKNPRLPSVCALYLAKALMASTAPFNPLYKPVNNFLIAKQHVDMTTIPDFLSLFHDSDVESAERRLWVLDVIKDGTKTMTDVQVVFKTMCLKMIMDYFLSELCDRKCKSKILGAINSIVSIPRGAEILIEGYGLVAWLHGIVRNMTSNDRVLFKKILDILNNIIDSSLLNNIVKVLKSNKSDKLIYNLDDLKGDKDLEYDLLTILYDLSKFVNCLEENEKTVYIKTFNQLTNKSMKLLSKKQVMYLIDECRVIDDNLELSNLLQKGLFLGNVDVLKSNSVLSNTSEMKMELVKFVKRYVM